MTTHRVYLSGPMSGIAENNFPEFHRWAKDLRDRGFDVVSPAEIEEAGTWEMCLRADLRELCTCDTIALMPGWENSKGAHLELHIAHRLGMVVMHLAETASTFNFAEYLHRQWKFSQEISGPGERTKIVSDYIRAALSELQCMASETERQRKWIDVVMLALDGALRADLSPEEIVFEMVFAQKSKEQRISDAGFADPNKAIEHVRIDKSAERACCGTLPGSRHRKTCPGE